MKVFEWRERAALSGKGIRYFFPETPDDLDRARAICGGCRVRAECLEYAGRSPSLQGAWGALTERERLGIRRRAA